MNTNRLRVAGLAVAAAAFTGSSHASLVLVGPQSIGGTGLGAVNTMLTLQSPGNATTESGAVAPNAAGNPVASGDAQTGASQLGTPTLAQLGITNAADLRIVMNAQEPGNVATNGIRLDRLTLSMYNLAGAAGTPVFSTTGPINFPSTFTGTGNSGFVFALDSAQAAQANALAGQGYTRLGLSAALSDATGGPETFFVVRSGQLAPIPEPSTWALLGAGLIGLLGVALRRSRRAAGATA